MCVSCTTHSAARTRSILRYGAYSVKVFMSSHTTRQKQKMKVHTHMLKKNSQTDPTHTIHEPTHTIHEPTHTIHKPTCTIHVPAHEIKIHIPAPTNKIHIPHAQMKIHVPDPAFLSLFGCCGSLSRVEA